MKDIKQHSMMTLKEYILEARQINDNLAKKVVNAILMKNTDNIKLEDIDAELSNYNYDMKAVLNELNTEQPQNKLDKVKEFLDVIWEYVDGQYSEKEASDIYGYISENLYKYTKIQ